MPQLRPRKQLTRRTLVDLSRLEPSLPASPFAAFLLHRNAARAEEGLLHAGGCGTARDARERARVGR